MDNPQETKIPLIDVLCIVLGIYVPRGGRIFPPCRVFRILRDYTLCSIGLNQRMKI